ncbi:MAG: NADH-quinone oxidoreductase subunit C [Desulfovibrionaceae bacterium]
MLFESTTVTPASLLETVKEIEQGGYRFVTLSQTVKDENTLILYYHFDKDLSMHHLRMEVDKTEKIPSIAGIYLCALLIENETQDQFGVRFDGLPLDYDGKMYLEGEVKRAPFFTMTTLKKVQEGA